MLHVAPQKSRYVSCHCQPMSKWKCILALPVLVACPLRAANHLRETLSSGVTLASSWLVCKSHLPCTQRLDVNGPVHIFIDHVGHAYLTHNYKDSRKLDHVYDLNLFSFSCKRRQTEYPLYPMTIWDQANGFWLAFLNLFHSFWSIAKAILFRVMCD